MRSLARCRSPGVVMCRSDRCAATTNVCAQAGQATEWIDRDTSHGKPCLRPFNSNNRKPHCCGSTSVTTAVLSAPLPQSNDEFVKRRKRATRQERWLSSWQVGVDPTRSGLVDQARNCHRTCLLRVQAGSVVHDEHCVKERPARERQRARQHAPTGALHHSKTTPR